MGKPKKKLDVGRFSVSKRPEVDDLGETCDIEKDDDSAGPSYAPTDVDIATPPVLPTSNLRVKFQDDGEDDNEDAWSYNRQLKKFVNVEGKSASNASFFEQEPRDETVIMMVETETQNIPNANPPTYSGLPLPDSGNDDAFQRTLNKYDLQYLGDKLKSLQDTPTVREIVKKIKRNQTNITQITAAPLEPKDVAEELRAHKDLIMFATVADESVVMLDIAPQTAEDITVLMLQALGDMGRLETELIPDIMNQLLTEVQLEGERQATSQQWRRSIQGNGYILGLAEVSELGNRHFIIARLRWPLNLGSWDGSKTKFVGLILAPPDTKRTKTVEETGQTFATLFSDRDFMAEATEAPSSELLQFAALKFVKSEISTREQIVNHVSETEQKGESDFAVALRGGGKLFGGIMMDIKRRGKVYKSDYLDGVYPIDWASIRVYFVAIISLYFACVVPCIAFGALWNSMTAPEGSHVGPMGVTEILLSEAICGTVFAIFGGQPLLVLRASGPIAIFGGVIFSWSETLDIPFLEFYACVGIWACLYCIIIGTVNMSYFVVYIGRFTEEAFAMLISCIFIGKALEHIIEDSTLTNSSAEDFLLPLTIVVGVWIIAMFLTSFYQSPYLRPTFRYILYMFGPLIAFALMTGFSYIGALPHVERLDLEVPAEIGIVTTDGRPWWVPFYDLEVKWVFLAAIAAVPLTMIVYLEQNVSALLIDNSENRLLKGSAFHWDMVLTGLLLAVSAVLGLPWCHGALPHSVIHPRLLADTEEYEKNGVVHTHVIRSRETRWVSLIAHIFFFLTILAKPLLRILPIDVLYGYFLYLGVASLQTNHLYTRLLLWFMQPENYPPSHYVRRVPIKVIHLFTLCQFVGFLLLWFVHDNFYLGDDLLVPPALLFPVVVFCLIPIRRFVLPRLFDEKYLKILTEDEPEEVFSNLNWVGGAARMSLLQPHIEGDEKSFDHKVENVNSAVAFDNEESSSEDPSCSSQIYSNGEKKAPSIVNTKKSIAVNEQ
eukprot:CFRG6152T1